MEPFVTKSTKEFENLSEHSTAFTGCEDEDVMVCGGVAECGLLWFRMSERCRGKYRWMRCAIETLRLVQDEVGTEMYSYVLDGFKDGERLASSVGMTKTDTVETYNGHRYYVWQRFTT